MLLEDVLTRKEGEILEKVLQKKMDANKGPAVIEIKNVKKVYRMGSERICAVDDVSFEINKGEFCCLLGTSGSGKSTLLNLMAGIEKASGGQILIKGKDVRKMSEKQLAKFRQKYLGFVFQSYNLLNSMTALENVELAAQICKEPLDAAKVLEEVGLRERMANFPAQLSGGEQQRVAIARALAKNPKLLLCDEPTGALDYNTGKAVLKLLQDTCRKKGRTVVVITHNQALTAMADRIITIKSGTVKSMVLNQNIVNVEEIEW